MEMAVTRLEVNLPGPEVARAMTKYNSNLFWAQKMDLLYYWQAVDTYMTALTTETALWFLYVALSTFYMRKFNPNLATAIAVANCTCMPNFSLLWLPHGSAEAPVVLGRGHGNVLHGEGHHHHGHWHFHVQLHLHTKFQPSVASPRVRRGSTVYQALDSYGTVRFTATLAIGFIMAGMANYTCMPYFSPSTSSSLLPRTGTCGTPGRSWPSTRTGRPRPLSTRGGSGSG